MHRSVAILRPRGALFPGMVAPVAEPSWPAARVRRRAARVVIGVSGLLLAYAALLPVESLDFIGDHRGRVRYAIDVPGMLPPYAYGLVLALGALAATARGVRWTILALRALTLVVLAGEAAYMLVEPLYGLLGMLAAAVVLLVVGWRAPAERGVARCTLVIGGLGTLWFARLASAWPLATAGDRYAFFASLGLLVGGLIG